MVAVLLAVQIVCSPFGTCARREVSVPDSTRIHGEARKAEETFERRRRDLLPYMGVGGSDTRCVEFIGRFCIFDDDREGSRPIPEDKEVIDARLRLIDQLESAAHKLPKDPWIAGQRVRYLVEANRPNAAETAAGECLRSDWWCAAITGYARHSGGDYAGAERAFDSALAMMPRDERCRWNDISRFLIGEDLSKYKALTCEERTPVEARFWGLADALLLTDGNERRTEHLWRWVQIRMQERAFPVFGVYWADDLAQFVLRFGWPAGWSQREPRMGASPGDYDIIAHTAGGEAFDPPTGLFGDDKKKRSPEHPRSRYAPAYAPVFDSLRSQIAVFRDADSVVIVGAYDFSEDSVPASTRTRSGLFFRPPHQGPASVINYQGEAVGTLSLRTVPGPGVVSLEVLITNMRKAGRTRQPLTLAKLDSASIGISDLLVLRRADTLPRSLAEATSLARPGLSARRGEVLGLYWETYGVGPATTPVAVAVTVRREGSSWLRRAARSLGLAGAPRPAIELAWDDMSLPGSQSLPGTVALDLGNNDPGRYTVTIEVSSRGRGTATAQREITITPE